MGSCIWRKPLKGQGLLSVFEGLDYLLNTQNFILVALQIFIFIIESVFAG